MVSDEDTAAIWEAAKKATIEKVKGNKNRSARAESPMVHEEEVLLAQQYRRLGNNRKMKKIILLEFKRAADSSESYYQDMWKVAEKQHTPILTGLSALAADRDWEVEVVPLVVGQRSVKERSGQERSRSPSSLLHFCYLLGNLGISVHVSQSS